MWRSTFLARATGRIRLRNKIIDCLNVWYHTELGCHVIPGEARFKQVNERKWRFFERLIVGTSKAGRAIWIYPANTKRAMHPINVMAFMREQEKLGAIVGIAYDTCDAFDIVIDRPLEYKRKDRTYGYRSTHGNRATAPEETTKDDAADAAESIRQNRPP